MAEDNLSSVITLNFHVDFPKTSQNSVQAASPIPTENSHVYGPKNIQDRKSNVIVLMGWKGAQHKYLEKYSEFYLKRGFIVLRCITPVRVIAHNHGMLPLVAKAVLSALKKYHLISHPLFFHAFSNGGAYLYSYVLKELESHPNLALNIRGTIFDSGPYRRTVFTEYRVGAESFESLEFLKPIIGGIVAIYFLITMLFGYISLGWDVCMEGEAYKGGEHSDEIRKPFELHGWLTRITNMKNHKFIFLYSKTDYIAPWEQVVSIASELEKGGNVVVQKEFHGTDHVAHYRKYPEEYVAAVDAFLQSCCAEIDT